MRFRRGYYDAKDRSRRSADAVQKLASLGYENLYDLGGILSWPYEIEGDFEGHF